MMLQGFRIAHGVLIQQFLKGTPVVQTMAHLRDEFVGDVDGEPTPSDPSVKDVTGVLSTAKTRLTALTHAGASTQTQRTECGGPQPGGLIPEPPFDISGRF